MQSNGYINNNKTNDLLVAYKRYVAYVKKFEEIVYTYSKEDLMSLNFLKEYCVDIKQLKSRTFPWNIALATDKEKHLFEQISVSDYNEYNLPYAFIGVDYIFNDKNDKTSFISLPSVLHSYSDAALLPDLYEHFIVAYKKDAKLKDTKFIIAGHYVIDYNWDCGNITLDEAMSSVDFWERMKSMITLTASLDKYKEIFDNKFYSIIAESLASRYVRPLETVILNSLARTAEISRSVLNNNYATKTVFSDAEKNNLISSARRFEDYINIRHLLHHQFDGFNGYGHFSYGKHSSIRDKRQKYINSYAKLCKGKMFDRLKAYIDVIGDFRKLVQYFYPNLLTRDKSESNSKFIKRIKDYKNNNPLDDLIIELNYAVKNENNTKLVKTINKLFPEAKVIDLPRTGFDSLSKELENYAVLTDFLKLSNDLDGYMSFACLSFGQNLVTNEAVKFLEEKNIINKDTREKLHKYRIIRNKLSHELFSDERADRLREIMGDFLHTYNLLIDTINQKIPAGVQVHPDVFCFTHENGLKVNINFEKRKILSVTDKDGHALITEKPGQAKRLNPYFSDGTYIDYKRQQIVFNENSILRFNSENNYCLTINNPKTGQKLNVLMDKKFKVKKYIVNGREMSVSRGDVRCDISSCVIRFDKNKYLDKITYKTDKQERKSISFNSDTQSYIELTNGQKINCNFGTPEVLMNFNNLSRKNKER